MTDVIPFIATTAGFTLDWPHFLLSLIIARKWSHPQYIYSPKQ